MARFLTPVVCAFALSGSAFCQAPQSRAQDRAVGEVTAVDAAGQRITVKSDKGEPVAIVLDGKTLFLKVPPGEKDLKHAVRVTLSDIGAGDRILARGTMAADQKTINAASVIVMNKTELAKKWQQDAEAWNQRGIQGKVTSVDAAKGEIAVEVRSREGSKTVEASVPPTAQLRRYAPDSVKFSDARPSSLAEVRPGDQIRVLGDKSEDGARIKAEQIVTGSFRTIPATTIAVNAASGELTVKDLESKKPLTVKVNADTTVRKLPPMLAMMLARRLNPTLAESGGTGGGGPPRGPQVAARGPGGPPDLQHLLERVPTLPLSDLKPGDAVIVFSTTGAEANRVTAITLLAGVEPILTAAPARQIGGMWDFGDIALPE